jgi:hypothetical protein
MSGHVARAWILSKNVPPEARPASESVGRVPQPARPWVPSLLLTGGSGVLALNVVTLWADGHSVVTDGGDRRFAIVSVLATGTLCLVLAAAGIALALTRRPPATGLALGATMAASLMTLLTFLLPSDLRHVGPVAILLLSYGTSRLAKTFAGQSPARTSPVS